MSEDRELFFQTEVPGEQHLKSPKDCLKECLDFKPDAQCIVIGERHFRGMSGLAVKIVDFCRQNGFNAGYLGVEVEGSRRELEKWVNEGGVEKSSPRGAYLYSLFPLLNYCREFGLKVVPIDPGRRDEKSEQKMLDNFVSQVPPDEKAFVYVGNNHARLEPYDTTFAKDQSYAEFENYPRFAQRLAESRGGDAIISIATYELRRDDPLSNKVDKQDRPMALAGRYAPVYFNSARSRPGPGDYDPGELPPGAFDMIILLPTAEHRISKLFADTDEK